jgi:ribosomal protein S18 acetylase RimI-like enzyme
MVNHAIAAARTAGARELELEVIDKNEAAIALYEGCGLKRIQRLLGFEYPADAASAAGSRDGASELTPCDAREVAAAIQRFGGADLPWQLSAENIAAHGPPARALRLGDQAWCLITDPEQPTVHVFSLLVAPEARRRGLARRLLGALRATFPGKTWRISPLVPDGERARAVERLGWRQAALGQWRMALALA